MALSPQLIPETLRSLIEVMSHSRYERGPNSLYTCRYCGVSNEHSTFSVHPCEEELCPSHSEWQYVH